MIKTTLKFILFCTFGNFFILNAQQNFYIIKLKSVSTKNSSIQNNFNLKAIFPNLNKKSNSTQNAKTNTAIQELSLYYKANLSTKDLNIISRSSEIESISKNNIFHIEQDQTNDIYLNKQYALAQVNAFKAWNLATGKGIKVAVIDTGIDWLHDDLKNQLWINPLEDLNKNGKFEPWSKDSIINGLSGDLDGIDNDNNGFPDDVIGYDFVDEFTANIGDASNIDPLPFDENGHGTNVSGVIAAQNNNSIGISGLAYNSKIMTIRAFDITGNGESDDIANAIVYAATNGAKVINMSFGDGFESPIMHAAIKYASSLGSIMVSASGNNSWSLPHYPSDYEEVISVAGTEINNIRFGSSNFGNQIDISAPAKDIFTTTIGNDYKTSSGTSFSSPYVSAAIALLCEKNQNLTYDNAINILQITAKDITGKGWTQEFGAGALDAYEALNYLKSGIVKINKPLNEELINIDNVSNLDIDALVNYPLNDSTNIDIGLGNLPTKWLTLSTIQGNDNKISKSFSFSSIHLKLLNFEKLYSHLDTTIVVRINSYSKNSKSIEKRVLLNLIKNYKNLTMKYSNIRNAYYDYKKIVIISAETNYKSNFKLLYRKKGSTDNYTEINEFEKSNEYHTIFLGDELESNIVYEGILQAYINESDTSYANITFQKENQEFNSNGMVKKSYNLPISILNNNISNKLYNNGLESICVNDMINLGYGKSRIYQFNNGKFITKDSSEIGYIPVGFGDSNQDGIEEIFTTGNFQNTLYQSKSKSGNPFESEIYSSGPYLKSGGSLITDMNKDNKPELIQRNDTSYFALKYENNTYSLSGKAQTKNRFAKYGNDKASAVGDFNDDGITDLAYLNEYGMLQVYSYQNGNFNEIYFDSTVTSFSSQYLISADIDGDGIKELIALNNGSIPLYNITQGNEQLWNLRIYKFRINKFDILYEEYFYGVRAGLINKVSEFYKNGLSSGDLDNDKKDEIILSLFPNLFILKWDNENNKLNPFWWYPSTLSNGFIINDFDKNGKKELAFTTFNDVSFFEFDGKQIHTNTPTGLKGKLIDTNSIELKWDKLPNGQICEIYLVNGTNQTFEKISEVANTNSFTIKNLNNYTLYKYTIRAINPKFQDSSRFSNFTYPNIAMIYTHPFVKFIDFKIFENDSRKFQFIYNGEIPLGNIDVNNFSITSNKSKKTYVPNLAISEIKNKVTLFFSDSIPKEENLYILSKSFNDFYNTPTIDSTIGIYIVYRQIQDTVYLKSLDIPDITTNRSILTLAYNQKVNSSALIAENYVISPFGTVNNLIYFNDDSSKIQMNLSKDVSSNVKGVIYTITAKNINSKNGNLITNGVGNSLSFVFSAKDLNEPYVFPSPIKLNLHSEAIFGNLTAKAKVNILNLEGNLLRVLEETGGDGGLYWDLKDSKGEVLQNGIYLFKITGNNINGQSFESELQKFVITQ